MHVDAMGAAVDLRHAQEDEMNQLFRQVRLLGDVVMDAEERLCAVRATSDQFMRVISFFLSRGHGSPFAG